MSFNGKNKATNDLAVSNLARQFNEAAIAHTDCVHLCIDVQKIYAVWDVARHIADNIAPAFRAAGIPNYWIHLSRQLDENNMPAGEYEFCQVKPLPGEKIIRKPRASAFIHTNLHNDLQERGTKLVIVSGFAFGCCVAKTVESALQKQYKVAVLNDGVYTLTREDMRDELAQKGVIFTDSNNLITALQTRP